MIRKFRRIFRSPPTPTTIKNETNPHPTSSTSDPMSPNKPGSSSVTNHLYSGKQERERERRRSRQRKKYHNSFIHLCIFFSRVFDLIEIIHQGEFVFFMFAGFILFFWFFLWRFHVHYLFVLQNDIQLVVIVVYAQ